MNARRPATAARAAGGARARYRSVGAVLVALVLLAAGACSSPPDPGAGGSATSSAEPEAPVATPEATGETPAGAEEIALSETLDHVHGLVVTGDGTLLAGTHTGVVAVTNDGTVSWVGTSRDDLMGMTGVPGTANLASSGHPGVGSAFPNPVGLILSEDGGLSWSAVSLTGQVDFHALATDGTLVVGYGGGNGVLVSTDGGRNFTTGAAIAPAALAITPAGVWATTADGVQRSVDDGQSFAVVETAPLLVLVAAGSDGSLWGVDTGGVAWRSPDGATWERRATVGPVEALAVADHATAYAMTATTLHALA